MKGMLSRSALGELSDKNQFGRGCCPLNDLDFTIGAQESQELSLVIFGQSYGSLAAHPEFKLTVIQIPAGTSATRFLRTESLHLYSIDVFRRSLAPDRLHGTFTAPATRIVTTSRRFKCSTTMQMIPCDVITPRRDILRKSVTKGEPNRGPGSHAPRGESRLHYPLRRDE